MSSAPAETRSFRGIPLPVIAVALAVGATLLGDSMLYAVMPSQPEAWALSIPAVGILLSVNRLVRLITNSVAAVLFQHFGRRGPFIAALILSVVVTLSYGWITSFTVLLVARMGWGLCWSTLRLGAFWTILTEARDDNRGFLMGAYQAIVRMGSVGGALVGAALTDAFGHRLTLTLFAAVMVATAATWIVSTHARAKREEPRRQRDEGGDLRGVLRDRRLLVTGCGILITGLVFSGLVTASLGFYLSAHFGPRIAILGTAVGVTSATGILLGVQWSLGLPLAPVLGHLSDRFGRIPIATVGFAVGAVGLLVLALAESVWLMLPAVLAAFVASMVLTVTLNATAGDLAPPDRRSAVVSTYATFLDLGSSLGPLIGLSFASLATLRGVYGGAAVLLLAATLLFRVAFRSGRSPRTGQAAGAADSRVEP